MSVNTWGAVNVWADAGVDADINLSFAAPVFNVSGGLGLSATVSVELPSIVFAIEGGAITDYPIATISFTVKKPDFKDNVYTNSFPNGYIRQAEFTNGIIKQSAFIGVNK